MSVCGFIIMKLSLGYHKGVSNEVKTSLRYQSQVAQQVHHNAVDWVEIVYTESLGRGGGVHLARDHTVSHETRQPTQISHNTANTCKKKREKVGSTLYKHR